MQNFDLAKQGQRVKGVQEGFCPIVKHAWRRCGNRLNAIFDLAKRYGKGLKLHGGFWGPGGTCFAQVLQPSKCSISTWQGKGKGRWQSAGKGLKLHRRVSGPGGTCFARVLKPSKCRISTWQGSGKGRKVHRRVSCPSETCLAQVWKPSKCYIRPGKALARGYSCTEGFGALVERASRRF